MRRAIVLCMGLIVLPKKKEDDYVTALEEFGG